MKAWLRRKLVALLGFDACEICGDVTAKRYDSWCRDCVDSWEKHEALERLNRRRTQQ